MASPPGSGCTVAGARTEAAYLDVPDQLRRERIRPLLFLEVRNGCGIVLRLLRVSDGPGLVGKYRDLAEIVSIDEARRIECDGPSVCAGRRQCALDAEDAGP